MFKFFYSDVFLFIFSLSSFLGLGLLFKFFSFPVLLKLLLHILNGISIQFALDLGCSLDAVEIPEEIIESNHRFFNIIL